jgi:hypothetical protein
MTAAERLVAALTDVLSEASPAHTVTVTAGLSLAWTPERFWSAPPATRLDATELADSLGVGKAAIYKRVQRHCLPCRKLPDGGYIFIVGDVRQWLEDREVIVNRFAPKVTSLRPRGVT